MSRSRINDLCGFYVSSCSYIYMSIIPLSGFNGGGNLFMREFDAFGFTIEFDVERFRELLLEVLNSMSCERPCL